MSSFRKYLYVGRGAAALAPLETMKKKTNIGNSGQTRNEGVWEEMRTCLGDTKDGEGRENQQPEEREGERREI